MMQIIINLMTQASSLVVLALTLTIINSMTAGTNHLVRFAYILIATAALAGILAPMAQENWAPTPASFLGMVGMAVLLIVDRRRCEATDKPKANLHIVGKRQGTGR